MIKILFYSLIMLAKVKIKMKFVNPKFYNLSMKKVLVLLFFILSNETFSAPIAYKIDSVGLEKRGSQTFIIHQVSEKETLFGISRRYKTTVNDLVQNNEVLQDGLKMGQKILIPYVEKVIPKPVPVPVVATVKEHKVLKGETLFSISKIYGVSVEEIKTWNALKKNDLSVGQSLKIEKENTIANAVPANNQATAKNNKKSEPATPKVAPPIIEDSQPSPVVEKKSNNASAPASATVESFPGNWITHTVSQGETLFSISKRYGTSVDEIMSWNGMSSNNLKSGQKLKVGREIATSSTVAVVPANIPSEGSIPASARNRNSNVNNNDPVEEVNTGYKNIKETGLAEVIEGSNNHKKYLVLHKTAPVGTIMRVRNEENDITIFARVVGKLPETGDNSRLVIKLSKAAFDQLRAVNARFPVEISF